METFKSFKTVLYELNEKSFADIALDLFRFQAKHNAVYRNFVLHLHLHPDKIHSLADIPFMPISFFKQSEIQTGNWQPETTFASSGTTGTTRSSHRVMDLQFYLDHSLRNFEHFFGPVSDYNILALLPSYLERQDSSLVAMIGNLIKKSGTAGSGFYLNDLDLLIRDLDTLRASRKKTILWGVSFALLDMVEKFHPDLSHAMIFETGGMKGRRKEITRQELHDTIKDGFNVSKVYSEYGMTELFSQAYSKDGDRFFCPPWMKILGRDPSDPLQKGLLRETSGINVIDLANWHSVGFIETEDLGKVFEDGSFEILGRMDNSDVRGCNLLVE